MKTQHTQNHIAMACLSLALMPNGTGGSKTLPTEIQLTPAGFFRAVDGRPADAPNGWYIDASIASEIITRVSALQNDLVIDYEHQTLHKEKNGQPAPAAGWFKHLEWREGSGLWAVGVKWTPQAEQAILSGQYRYLSPVFEYEPASGRVLSMRMAAITNSPGLDGMQSLASLTLDQFNQLTNLQQEEPVMKELLAKLGLPDTATESEAMAALTAIMEVAATAETAKTQIADLTAKANAQPDPAKYVPIEVVTGLKTQLAALTQSQAQLTVEQTVANAIEANLLTLAEKDWALSLGKSNLAHLTAYLETQKPLAAFTAPQVKPGEQPPSKTATLTAEQQSVMAMFGNSAEDLAKYANPL
ncbi:MAG: phage protease [Thiomicrospira sp.]